MASANWADDEVSDDERDMGNTPEEIQQDRMLGERDKGRGAAPVRENRDHRQGGMGGGGGGRDGGRMGGGDRMGGRDRGGGRDYDRRDGGRGGDRQERAPRPKATVADIPVNGPYVIYCGNLNFQTNAQSLGEHFINNGCNVTDVILAEDDSGRSRGFGHVHFETRDDVIRAMEGDGSSLDDRQIRVDVDRKTERRGNDRGGDRGGSGFGGERRPYAEPTAADTDESWGRGAKKPQREREERKPREEGREGGLRREGGMRGGDRGDRDDGKPIVRNQTEQRKERPKINIAPRTVPLDAPVASSASSSIFGDAKPRDGKAFEKEEKVRKPRGDRTDGGERKVKDKGAADAKKAEEDKDKPQRDPRKERAEHAAKQAAKGGAPAPVRKTEPKAAKVRTRVMNSSFSCTTITVNTSCC